MRSSIRTVRRRGSSVLVIRGGPGIGKTSLIEHALEFAEGVRLVRARGTAAEQEIPFGLLNRLFMPLANHLDGLPDPAAEALASIFGRRPGPAPGPLLLCMSVLQLLSAAGRGAPTLVVVDDLDRSDGESRAVLACVARRLTVPSIGIWVTTSVPVGEDQDLQDLPELPLAGIPGRAAAELLRRSANAPIPPWVARRLISDTGGHPLALAWLASVLPRDQITGRRYLPEPLPVPARVALWYRERARRLPASARTSLALLAAEPRLDPVALDRAIARLEGDPDRTSHRVPAGQPPGQGSVLARAAIYWALAPRQRRRLHRAIAEVVDPVASPDLQAWHRALGSEAPAGSIAAELESTAAIAAHRDSWARGAEFLERAAELSPAPADRIRRWVASAEAHLAAGHGSRAEAIAGRIAESGVRGPWLDRLRGRIAFDDGYYGEAAAALARSAAGFRDPAIARELRLWQLLSATRGGANRGHDLDPRRGGADRDARDPGARVAAFLDLLGDATDRTHLGALPRGTVAGGMIWLIWFRLAFEASLARWDLWALHVASEVWVGTARSIGARSELATALAHRCIVLTLAGELGEAAARLREARRLLTVHGGGEARRSIDAAALLLRAWRGARSGVEGRAGKIREGAAMRRDGAATAWSWYAEAVLASGLESYGAAARAAARASEGPPVPAALALPELVEAASRLGDRRTARWAVRQLEEAMGATEAPWGRGILARSRAVATNGTRAERSYREALGHLEQAGAVPDLARTHLLFGEWLRRERRQREARTHLREAQGLLRELGAEGYARRAWHELRATGAHSRRSRVEQGAALTPQELRIVELAAQGASNPEIAATLFISRRTVEYHLSKVFSKLGITTRTQLVRSVGRPGPWGNGALSQSASVG